MTTMQAGEVAFLRKMIERDMAHSRKVRLGYTIEEERLWRLYNRCCHAGRPIKILPRKMVMGSGGISIRIPGRCIN